MTCTITERGGGWRRYLTEKTNEKNEVYVRPPSELLCDRRHKSVSFGSEIGQVAQRWTRDILSQLPGVRNFFEQMSTRYKSFYNTSYGTVWRLIDRSEIIWVRSRYEIFSVKWYRQSYIVSVWVWKLTNYIPLLAGYV